KAASEGTLQENTPPPAAAGADPKNEVTRILMEKFPTFDPSWPDNLKTSWFSAYEQLMKRNK
ncbi:MAG TPA: hypothetical protein VN678_06335, partial [Acidobacteriaceae bacterium]|nr:hypothetical protein [Acidobacteriaceae bacterium]